MDVMQPYLLHFEACVHHHLGTIEVYKVTLSLQSFFSCDGLYL